MVTKKKRTSLDALVSPVDTDSAVRSQSSSVKRPKELKAGKRAAMPVEVAETTSGRDEIVRQTLYLPLPVFDQLRDLLFEEQRGQVKRRRMHDYFLEGIDLLFKDRGLKSIQELKGRE
jgi:hypothetical protein